MNPSADAIIKALFFEFDMSPDERAVDEALRCALSEPGVLSCVYMNPNSTSTYRLPLSALDRFSSLDF